jgi:uncharacterized protein YkwD
MLPRLLCGMLVLLCATAAKAEIEPAQVLEIVNRYRAELQLQPLSGDARLDAAAAERIRDMEELGYWAHRSPEGRSPFEKLALHGYRHAAAGENLARGFETAEVLVAAWLESPGHRANLLSPRFRQAGFAVIDGFTTGRGTGRSIVMLFGSEMRGGRGEGRGARGGEIAPD